MKAKKTSSSFLHIQHTHTHAENERILTNISVKNKRTKKSDKCRTIELVIIVVAAVVYDNQE